MKESFNQTPESQEMSLEKTIKKLREKLYNRTLTLVAVSVLFATTVGLFKHLNDDKKDRVTKDAEKIKNILKQSNVVHHPPKNVVLPVGDMSTMPKQVAGMQSYIPEYTGTVEVYNDLSEEDAKQVDDILLDIQETIDSESNK